MAIIECPECRRKISSFSVSCIGCGFPLDKHIPVQTKVPPPLPKDEQNNIPEQPQFKPLPLRQQNEQKNIPIIDPPKLKHSKKDSLGCGTIIVILIMLVIVGFFIMNALGLGSKSNAVSNNSTTTTYNNSNVKVSNGNAQTSSIGTLSIEDSCNALNSIGITTDPYKKNDGDIGEYSNYNKVCLSNYTELKGTGSLLSNMAYYAFGSETKIKLYQFTANINDLSSEDAALNMMKQAAEILIPKVTGTQPTEKLLSSILNHTHYKKKIGKYVVSVDKTHLTKGYGITLNIKTH